MNIAKEVRGLVLTGKIQFMWVEGAYDMYNQLMGFYRDVVGVTNEDHLNQLSFGMKMTVDGFSGAACVMMYPVEMMEHLRTASPEDIDEVLIHTYLIVLDKNFMLSLSGSNRAGVLTHEIGHAIDSLRRGCKEMMTGNEFESEINAWLYAAGITKKINPAFKELALDSYRKHSGMEIVSKPEDFMALERENNFFRLQFTADMFLLAEDEYDIKFMQEEFDHLLKEVDTYLV